MLEGRAKGAKGGGARGEIGGEEERVNVEEEGGCGGRG